MKKFAINILILFTFLPAILLFIPLLIPLIALYFWITIMLGSYHYYDFLTTKVLNGHKINTPVTLFMIIGTSTVLYIIHGTQSFYVIGFTILFSLLGFGTVKIKDKL